MNPIAIVGIGQTDFSWASERTEAEMAVIAIRNALTDAGLTVADVDGVVRFAAESTMSSELVALTGMKPLAFSADDGNGGSFSAGLLGLAQAAINTGRARVVVAFRSFNGRSGRRLGRPDRAALAGRDETHMTARGTSPVGGEFAGPYGLVSPAYAFALWVRAYMAKYQLSAERMQRALAAVTLHQRRHAAQNPSALLRDRPLTPADYAASPLVAAPLRKADICLETDGAAAIVMTDADAAKGCRQPPVYILGTAQHILPGYHNLFLMESDLPPRVAPNLIPSLLAKHRLSLQDIDVIGLYDACSFSVINDLEGSGLAAPGTAVDWVLNPTIPFNTSGGHLAEVYLNGMNHIAEIVRQLRGQSTAQVPDARVGLAGGAGLFSAALLAKEVRQ